MDGFQVHEVPKSVYYIPNFITDSEEQLIISKVNTVPKPKWTQLSNRRLQNWGGIPHPKGMISEPIPQWLQEFIDKVAVLEAFDESVKPNHVLINEYLPGQGIMHWPVLGLNWTFKKFKSLSENEIKQWSCASCRTSENTIDIDGLKSKIQDLSNKEEFDTDESLTLAAELGNALLNENSILKQQLHDARQEKSKNELEEEDKLQLTDKIINDLQVKNQNLHCEISFLQNRLENEQLRKSDPIKDAENDKNISSQQINDLSSLNSSLRNKIHKLETELSEKNKESEELKINLKAQNKEIKSLKFTIQTSHLKNIKLDLKLTEFETNIKTLTKTFLNSFRLNLNSGCLTQSNSTRDLQLTSTTLNKNHLTMTSSLNESQQFEQDFCNPVTSTKPPILKQTATDKLFSKKKFPQMTTIAIKNKPIVQDSSFKMTNRPPASAKVLPEGVSLENFFMENIEYYKKVNTAYVKNT